MSIDAECLVDEDGIVWRVDNVLTDYDYVRQNLMPARTRRRPINPRFNGEVVGWSTLRPTAESEEDTSGLGAWSFYRRVFWVAPHDRIHDPDGVYRIGAPMEAVDPRTVGAGVPGELTERAWGSPNEWVE